MNKVQKISSLFQPIRSIAILELKEKLLEKPVLLNVRALVEYRGGYIEGTKNIPLQSINRYDRDKEKTVYMICQSGIRGKQAAKELKKSGYDMVNVRGDTNQWFDRAIGGK